MVAQCFQKLTLSKATTKFLLRWQTFHKRRLSRHSDSLSIILRLLDCLMPHKLFNAWWTPVSMVSKVRFHTWTIHDVDLRTGKRTFATWKHFLQHWPPIVSRSIWTMCFCCSNFGIPWAQHFGCGIYPGGEYRCHNQNIPPPSGHQAIAMFPRHGEFLLPFLA